MRWQPKSVPPNTGPILVSPRRQRLSRFARLAAVAFTVFLLVMVAIVWSINKKTGPFARAYMIRFLEEHYEANVEMGKLTLTMYPTFHAEGEDLIIRRRNQPVGFPAFILVRKFTVDADTKALFRDIAHVQKLRLEGFEINVPPAAEKNPDKATRPQRHVPSLIIDELQADGTLLRIHSRKPGKEPMEFDIQRLALRSVGKGQPMSFTAKLLNPTPPGLIDSNGYFGPWRIDDLGQTPVSGAYTFRDANLSVFHGISGRLSSEGRYNGRLDSIEVEGSTDTPDFTVGISGNPVHLRTQFKALVDGTNGETRLHPVTARFLDSTVVASGAIENRPGTKGKTISLMLTADDARIHDLMRLAVKHNPPLTGTVRMKARFELPPGKQDIADKLYLQGWFSLEGARFTDADVQHKILTLSHRGRGINRNEEVGMAPERILSDLKGSFQLKKATMSFSELAFQVPGAMVSLHGTYALRNEVVDLTGELRLHATVSQTTTGIKAFLLKPFDPLFSRGHSGTVLPITVTGTGNRPHFGVNKRKLFLREK